MTGREQDGPEALVEHLKECRKVDVAIVQDGNADELVASLISQGWAYTGVEYVSGKRVRYLEPPPGFLAHGTRPSDEDSLERGDEDPPGWHVREKTGDGYPLTGSSPAERQEAQDRSARIRRQAMRDHPFQGEGTYCEARIPMGRTGSDEAGYVSGWVQCGYGRDTHEVEGHETPSDAANRMSRYIMDALSEPAGGCKESPPGPVVTPGTGGADCPVDGESGCLRG